MAVKTYALSSLDHADLAIGACLKYIVADTEAERPTTDLSEGDPCYCKDTDKLYKWDGAAWIIAVNKTDVGLGNADNTSDVNKPVSSAAQTALDAKLDDTQFSGLAKISVGTVAPVSPAIGDLWVDTN